MQQLLGSEYDEFIKSYEDEHYKGLRVNTLKISVDEFREISPFDLKLVPWTRDGFYYYAQNSPGKHPYYYAGLYYMQEPSAMAPGAILSAEPGERVLDLCAAPGGKTIQIAASMKGEGILVSNDISDKRIRGLDKNIKLYGVVNSVITNETPQRLAINFEGYFDRIMVDAPCSGEGMMRKDESAAKSWEKFSVENCTVVQRDILKYVDIMLKPGGHICYSTCTFSPEENEGALDWFLNQFSHYEVVEIMKVGGMSDGRPDWVNAREELYKCARFWPHNVKGEGHFVALIKKTEGVDKKRKPYKMQHADENMIKLWKDFKSENILDLPEREMQIYGNAIYSIPNGLPDMQGIKTARTGLKVGSIENERFKPSQALIMSLKAKQLNNILNLNADGMEVERYLKGETLIVDGQKGWTAVCVDNLPLGWAKQMDGILKNGYPKGWRKL
jgi:NOL1/NOP2/sun family putative RNA methylase